MGFPMERKHRCLSCGTRFGLSIKELRSHSKPHCPGCGSLHYEAVRLGETTPALDLAGVKKNGRAKAESGKKSEKQQAKLAARAKLLSQPTNYRLAVIRNLHKKRAERAAEERRRQREADFIPLKD